MPLLRRHRLLLLLLLVAASHGDSSGDTYDASMCQLQPKLCGNVNISYPFYFAKERKVLRGYADSYCGYPGLEIVCEDDKPILLLNDGENYTVTGIDGERANVTLADPEVLDERCPRVDRNVTIPPASWLYFPSSMVDHIVFLLGCRPIWTFFQKLTMYQISCQSFDAGESFVLPEDKVPPGNLSLECRRVIEVPVLKYGPVDPVEWRNGGYGKLLRLGFQLAWNASRRLAPCGQCERSSGRCGYNKTGDFIGCLCTNGRLNSYSCSSTGSDKKVAIIAGVAGGFSALLVAGAIAIFFVRKRKQKVTSSSKLLKYSGSEGTPRSRGGDMESGSVKDLQTHLFSYEELEEATDSFNDNRELGDGGFGIVYKGNLRDGRVVAVKRLYNNSLQRVEQFVNEAAILSRLRHPNLVMFYGCTSSHSRELLLVYEFVPNGTVADHLHGHRAPERALTWPLRLNIAIESAAALTYLHAIEPPIVHRDVKTNNILLDAHFHVKVADFGLSRLFPLDVTHVSTCPQGTPGYVKCYLVQSQSVD